MPSLASSVASEAPTFSPVLTRGQSVVISTVPLLIFVGMFRACEQEPNPSTSVTLHQLAFAAASASRASGETGSIGSDTMFNCRKIC